MAGLLPDTQSVLYQDAQPSYTWRIDWEQKRLSGMTDGSDALQQAILLALLTPRFEHVIYSFQYGSELESLIGRDAAYAVAAAPALAEEALQSDDRVKSVQASGFQVLGSSLSGMLDITASGLSISMPVSIGKGVNVIADPNL